MFFSLFLLFPSHRPSADFPFFQPSAGCRSPPAASNAFYRIHSRKGCIPVPKLPVFLLFRLLQLRQKPDADRAAVDKTGIGIVKKLIAFTSGEDRSWFPDRSPPRSGRYGYTLLFPSFFQTQAGTSLIAACTAKTGRTQETGPHTAASPKASAAGFFPKGQIHFFRPPQEE